MITRYDGADKIADVTSGTYDSGWVDIEWTSNFKDYADLPHNGAQVRRIGNIVYLRGVADVTLNSDNIPEAPAGPRLIVDNTTGYMPSLGPGIYDFFLKGSIADAANGGIVTHSGLDNSVTRYFNRIEALVGQQMEFLTTNNADYSFIRGVCPGISGKLSIYVRGTITLMDNAMLILFHASGSGTDWEEVGKVESVMPNNTLPAGTLQLYRNSQSTPVTRLVVNKISG